MEKNSKIYVAGHRGLVGSALVRRLTQLGYFNLITRTRQELDLTNRDQVRSFFSVEMPEYVFNAAAKVGGIKANDTYPVDFLFDNLFIQANIIESAARSGVKKLVGLSSVCVYPKFAPVPVKEEYLLTGLLEPTNEWYAIAKITGIKMAQAYRKQYGANFISVMPVNLFGIGDNFHPDNSHVIPGMIRRFHEAKMNQLSEVVCWGDGSPRREFMYADDCADGLVFLMDNYDSGEIINLGQGEDWSISQISEMVKEVVGYEGNITWDTSRPNGSPRRLVDNTKMSNLGWRPQVDFKFGLNLTYQWFLNNQKV
jgi:GDP-L-fucose synthase